MLPPKESPLHQLVEPWWIAERRPTPFQVPDLREALLQAAIEESQGHRALKIPYDPFLDHRLRWATQYLEVAEGYRTSVDEGLYDAARMLIEQPTLTSGKLLAAGSA